MTAPILEIRNLHKSFGGLAVTRDVSLSLVPGEIHALIGPNGAGKSTLVNLIVGELRSDGGMVLLRGAEINDRSTHERVLLGLARSFQVSSVIKEFTVLDNARLAALGCKLPTLGWWRAANSDVQATDKAIAALRMVGLAHRTDALVSTLSYGERRHLELAMALALEPAVLLLDEPMAGVGTEEAHGLTDLIAELRQERAILMIEHDMDVVYALADRVSVLVEGQIIATAPPDEIRNMEQVRRAYFGTEDVW